MEESLAPVVPKGQVKLLIVPSSQLTRLLQTSSGAAFFVDQGIPIGAELQETGYDPEYDVHWLLYWHASFPAIELGDPKDAPLIDMLIVPFTLSPAEVERLRHVSGLLNKKPTGLVSIGGTPLDSA